MIVALGRTAEDEYQENLSLVSEQISGNELGLLFTDKSKEEVLAFFSEYKESEFARAGFVADQRIQVQAGPLKQFPHNQVISTYQYKTSIA